MPSSSCSSRASAASGVSPGSRLPPGNSHSPARSRPSVRRARRMRPVASAMTAAMTWMDGSDSSAAASPAPSESRVPSPESRLSSGQLAMAVLELLAAAARARVVAADLGHGGLRAGLGLRLLRLFVRTQATGVGMLELHLLLHALGRGTLGRLHRRDFLFAADAHPRQQRHDVVLHLVEQLAEQVEGFVLVLLLRLLLGIAAQVDALAQVVHARQVLLPVVVEHAEHDVLLDRAHGVGANLLFLGLEQLAYLVLHFLGDGLGIDLLAPRDLVDEARRQAEARGELGLEAGDVPLFVDGVVRDEAAHQVGDHVLADAVDVVLDAVGFQQLVALLVDDLALVVVDVVEVEQVLADIEVVRLDLALRVGDLLGDHRAFDDVVFLQAHPRHHLLHPVGREDAHQVVFQRQVEAAGTRVALAAGAAAQLVVDAPRLVALGAEDVQAAGGLDLVVALLPLGLQLRLRGLVDRRAGLGLDRCDLRLQRTAEHDVGTAAGHVGGDGDRARAAGLGDDLRLALVLLGVEHFVRDAGGVELFAEHFRNLDRGGADQDRLALGVHFLDLVDHRAVLAGAVEEHRVRMILAHHRPVGGDDHHFQAVDRLELVSLGIGRTGHAGELAVHAEQVLEGDRRQRLVLALYVDPLLGLDRLVQAVGPAAAGQGAAGELVDDDHLAVADDVVHVALVQRVRAQRGVEVMDDVDVVRGVQAVLFAGEDAGAAQQAFGLLLAFLGQVHLLALLVDPVVALAVLLLLAGEVRDDLVDLDVQLRRVVGRAGNDQRGTRLVDQDRVD